ncbi:MAG: undecaprenyl/decaprenyl-phosphate alpha-N-acetylglucosaminyl 1-phosphate transferase [Armatimonadetes bacterium]|nr:undecaprenyl/decaprenyl-phosphate alpha-N-acetylglucosaminyl 1-phosphate transferase [Armatimonadota bacterium]
MKECLPYIPTFLTAFSLTFLLTPLVYRLALKLGVLDQPGGRKVHEHPVPKWGGLAVFLGFFISLAGSIFFVGHFRDALYSTRAVQLAVLMAGGLVMMVMGALDDVLDLRPLVKLLVQVLVASAAVGLGIRISYVSHPLTESINYLPLWMGAGLTILWIVGISNAMNLLDGLDGLLAGVTTISALTLFIISLMKGQIVACFLLAAVAGSTLAFLRYNFHPARIFMGDTGSQFLGFTLACIAVLGALKVTTTVAVLIPLLVLGLPIFDTSWAIFRRYSAGKHIFHADKDHLHHRLLRLGLSQRQVAVIIYLLCGCLGAIAIYLTQGAR